MNASLVTLSPELWARSDIAERAAQIAAAEPVEHHRRWATLVLEAVLTLIDLAGLDATSGMIEECLLDPTRLVPVWDAARASERFSESSVPIPMMDALIALQQTPADVREMQYIHVVHGLRKGSTTESAP